ncbi:RNA dependent RNA polymerase [Red clover powdery mildew-associated totivirus 2]|uniref:RNA-directed RNA polymerase n=1 Tax=Red clover powdery mildew-associated totivirus 2 TaxID=1714363 RepID=A0A0S3Q2X1_9VIRU|nr:RNA dependent RNA polymerase [Red clover powdery mildew-associated totivirus 2]BAT62480.1 RNA dependent RNA polymerase [Red clover powdery mildew-associated totivirus 2]
MLITVYILMGLRTRGAVDEALLNVKALHKLHGQYVLAIPVLFGNVIAYYVDKHDVTMADKKVAKQAGLVIANNVFVDFCPDARVDYIAVMGNMAKGLHKKTRINDRELIRSRISQRHHMHIKVGMLDSEGDENEIELDGVKGYIMHRLMKMTTVRQTVTTFLLYVELAPSWAADVLAVIVSRHSEWAQLMDDLKLFSMYVKQYQHVIRSDLAVLFELNVLANRSDSEMDWAADIAKRTKSVVATPDQERLYRDGVSMFTSARAEGKQPVTMKWEEYRNMTWGLTPPGAVHSPEGDFRRNISTIPSKLRNKKTYNSVFRPKELKHYMAQRPKIIAKPSVKYEWGKNRALYGCDLVSHMMTDFGMMQAESTLPSWMPTGRMADENRVKRQIATMGNGIPFCYDFDDFNSQHSVKSMQTVITAWYSVYGDLISDEQKLCVDWVVQSLETQLIINSVGLGSSKYIEVDGTLFSGWRLTSFMNTCLNYLYLEQANVTKRTVGNIHNGDDVYANIRTIGDALDIMRDAKSIGVRAQMTKTNIGTIGEFLRIDNKAVDATGAQYLTRSCATAVHGRIESDTPNSTRSVVEANMIRLEALKARGGDSNKIKVIKDNMISRIARKHDTSEETICDLIETPKALGGLKDDNKPVPWRLIIKLEGELDSMAYELANKMKKAVNNYHKAVCDMLEVEMPTGYDMLNGINEGMLQTKKMRIEKIKIDIKLAARICAMHKAWGGSGDGGMAATMRIFTDIKMHRKHRRLRDQVRRLVKSGDFNLWFNTVY